MKKTYFSILFIFAVQGIFAQGMFTEKGRFSLDVGIAYVSQDDYDAIAYNLSSSLFGLFDIGVIYSKALPSNQSERAEGGTAYIDFFMKKDSSWGIVLNTAFSTFNYNSAVFTGISVYAKLSLSKNNILHLFPLFSIGVITAEDFYFALGLGFAIEYSLSNNFSLVVTPGFNTSNDVNQVVVSLELILK